MEGEFSLGSSAIAGLVGVFIFLDAALCVSLPLMGANQTKASAKNVEVHSKGFCCGTSFTDRLVKQTKYFMTLLHIDFNLTRACVKSRFLFSSKIK